jgi:hypothetical protein
MSNVIYVCGVCDKRIEVKDGAPAPQCCKREMEPLPFCTSVPNAEMSRNYDADEPCADGTTPKKR